MSGDKAYHVGYGKPPKRTQFQKGRSGNPGGRPKGTANFATMLRRALFETVIVNERGQKKRMKKIEVALRQQINKAAAGDARALRLVTQLLREMSDGKDFQQSIVIKLSPDDSRL